MKTLSSQSGVSAFDQLYTPLIQQERRLHVYDVGAEILDGSELLTTHDDVHRGIATINAYVGRKLIALGLKDLVVVPSNCYELFLKLVEYHNKTDVSCLPLGNIIPVEVPQGMKLSDAVLHQLVNVRDKIFRASFNGVGLMVPFIETPSMESISKALGTPMLRDTRSSETLNNKAVAMPLLQKNHIDIPHGYSAFTVEQAMEIGRQLLQVDKASKCVVKLGRSVSGLGIFRFQNLEELAAILLRPEVARQLEKESYFVKSLTPDDTVGIRLERWAHDPEHGSEVLSSPGAVIHVGRTSQEDRLLCISGQILNEESVHLGNCWPLNIPNDRMRKWVMGHIYKIVDQVATLARAKKAYGFVGMDFIVVREIFHGVPNYRVQVVELNCRETGQTHALAVHNILGTTFPTQEAWLIDNNAHSQEVDGNAILKDHEQRNVFFERGRTKRGIIVTNTATLPEKAQVLVLGNKLEVAREIMTAV